MALLAHLMDCQPGGEDRLRAWVDDDFLPRRMEVPGVLGAGAYESVREGGPRFLTLIEADSIHVFYDEPWTAVEAEVSDADREAASLRTDEVRLVCGQVFPGHAVASPNVPTVDVAGLAPVVQLGRIFVPPEQLADFNGWYAKERIPRVLDVPGVRRIRRYAPVEGDPVMVVLYEMEDEAVRESPVWRKASDTEWSARVRGYYRQAPGSPGLFRRRGYAH